MESFIGRKDSIILSAIDIIDEMGVQGLSTKNIAARQGIVESALYRHFKSKGEIIVAILEFYSRFDQLIYDSVKVKDLNSRDKIICFIKSFVEYYENYPAISSIMNSYEIFSKDEGTEKLIKNIFSARLLYLAELIKDGQAKGELSSVYTPDVLSRLINGFLRISVLEWRFEKYKFPLKEKVLNGIEKLLSEKKTVD